MSRPSSLLIAALLGSFNMLPPLWANQPIRQQNCPGDYEFYGHLNPHSGLQILYVIAGRKEDLTTCWSRIRTRMEGAAPLHEDLSKRSPSSADQRLLKETAAQLGLQDAYVHNLGA